MATAYICVVRNDLDANGLQVLDLKPNDSQRNYIYDGHGQTSYLSFLVQNSVVATHTPGAGVLHTSGLYYGLAAYLIDHVDDMTAGHLTLTSVKANAIAALIMTRLSLGQSLTLAAINAAIVAGGAVGSGLTNGTPAGSQSVGSVADVLKICQGLVYRLPNDSVISDAAGVFHNPHVPKGTFAVNGDADYRGMRQFELTGELLISAASGVLSVLKNAAVFAWINPVFTYGAGGTALTVGGTNIPATGLAAGVVVYDKDGNVV